MRAVVEVRDARHGPGRDVDALGRLDRHGSVTGALGVWLVVAFFAWVASGFNAVAYAVWWAHLFASLTSSAYSAVQTVALRVSRCGCCGSVGDLHGWHPWAGRRIGPVCCTCVYIGCDRCRS